MFRLYVSEAKNDSRNGQDKKVTTKVVDLRKESYSVYIGRGSIFGNPYKIGRDGNREEVVQKYKEMFLKKIEKDPMFRDAVLKLNGKTLGCFCSPLKCHGDVIIEWLEENYDV